MVLLILLPPLGCSCLIILACFWCHRCRQKRRQSPRGLARTGTATATAAAARAPRAPCAAWLHKAAAAARKAFRRARPASAGDVLQDRARGPDMAAALAGSPSYVNVGPAAAAPADNTYSLASNPYELPDSVETPRASYMTMGPAAAAPAGKTLYLASSHSYATVGPPTAAPAGKALPLAGSPTYVNMAPNAAAPAGKTLPLACSPSYAAVAPDAAASPSKTLPLASSPYARPGRVETPRAFYTAAAPHVAASASWPLPPAAIAGAGMEQAPGGSYAAGPPDAAASRDTLPLGASASALAGVLGSPARAPGAAAASETMPLGASLEDLPPPPSPAKEPSDREFVFPSPPAFSPAGSRGSMRLPS
nr:proline-rich protein 36-like [Pelodiscus sinensis]|eukprot:XP_025041722.1 proline-rich protein 36-like [Pelodiscus sinensis]